MKRWLGEFVRSKGRHLTAIYFFERGNTQRLSIPISKILVLGAAAVLALVWSIAGTGMLLSLWKQNQQLQNQIIQAQQGVFYYQTKYENVFEKTYKRPSGEAISEKPEKDKDSKKQSAPTKEGH